MKILSSVLVVGLSMVGVANLSSEKHSLGLLGSLVKSNAQGDYRFNGASTFTRSGTRGYVGHFAKLLASDPTQISTYEDVMTQGIRVWEDENRPNGFTNDLAGSFAFFTYVNLALAKNQDYKDYLFPNLVSQYRKALASRQVGMMSNAKKQDMYDYMVAESVYLQALASMGRDKNIELAAKTVRDTSSYHVRETFGADPATLSITESGLQFQ